jgi:hypothetical protein
MALIDRTSRDVTGQYFDWGCRLRAENRRSGSLLTRIASVGTFDFVAPQRTPGVIRTREGAWGGAVRLIAEVVSVIVIDARYSTEPTLAEAKWLRERKGGVPVFWVVDGGQRALLAASAAWQPHDAPAPVVATPETITQRVIEAVYGDRRPKAVNALYDQLEARRRIHEAAVPEGAREGARHQEA